MPIVSQKSPTDLPSTVSTVPEACRELNVSRSHFYRLIREGKVRVIRFGRSVRVSPEERQRLIREGTD